MIYMHYVQNPNYNFFFKIYIWEKITVGHIDLLHVAKYGRV
jgi:hypothetical protein